MRPRVEEPYYYANPEAQYDCTMLNFEEMFIGDVSK